MSHIALKRRLINGRQYEPGQVVDLSGLTEKEIAGRVLAGVLQAEHAVGPQGPRGLLGAPGPAGPEGPQGPPGLDGPQGPPGVAGAAGATGPVGPAVFTPRGPWTETDTYDEGDVVTWGGSSYYSTVNPSVVGTPPTGTTADPGNDLAVNTGWAFLAVQGAQGPQGVPGVQGLQGIPGASVIGAQGPPGPQGPAGVGSAELAFSASTAHLPGARTTGVTYVNGSRRRSVQAAFRISASAGGNVRLIWRAVQAGTERTQQEFGYSESSSPRSASVSFLVDPGGTYRIDAEYVIGGSAAQVSWVETDS